MTQPQAFTVFSELLLLLVMAYAGGALLARLRQPRVIGELLGGVVLGPSVFGLAFPAAQQAVFPDDATTSAVIGVVAQAGLLCLLFVTGNNLESLFARGERRPSIVLAGCGLVIPFAAGIALLHASDAEHLLGPAHDRTALALVFAAAIAVTSIPVISRIFLDLRIIRTRFARIVLGSALIEDVVLYAVLAVAVGIAVGGASQFGLADALAVRPGTAADATYYAVAVAALLLGALRFRGSHAAAALARATGDSLAATGVVALTVTCGVLALGLPLLFGGLIAGLAVGGAHGEHAAGRAQAEVERVAMSSLIPFYFATVGFKIDVSAGLDLGFAVAFVAVACLVKGASVYAGARLLREPPAAAVDFAVALNARGGPGIVLASVALDADIISQQFYTVLIGLAIVTSSLAGSWLERRVRISAPERSTSLKAHLPVGSVHESTYSA
jgi:Kef-type K+ transport system membrane component KefB